MSGRVGRVLLALVVLAAGLCLAELALRWSGIGVPARTTPLGPVGPAGGSPFSRPDDELIYALVPGAATIPWYVIDAHGYRTPPFTDAAAPGTTRIIVAGDSTTFGLGVLEAQRWSSVLRRALAELVGDVFPVEIINAGVPGYSTLQTRLQIERDLLELRPDLVIVLVTGGNDCQPVDGPTDAETLAERQSLAGRLARLRLVALLAGRSDPEVVPWPGRPAVPATGRVRVPLDEVQANLRAMADLLPGRLVLAIHQPRRQRAERAGMDDVAAAVAAVAAERGLPLADARPLVEALSPCPLDIDTMHPSPLGHRLIAEAVLGAVLPALALPPARREWIAAWLAARDHGLAGQAGSLRAADAPPCWRRLLASCIDPAAFEARLAARDPGLPASMLEADPLSGSLCAARSAARWLLRDPAAPELAEIRRWIVPQDPLLRCFRDEAAFLGAGVELRTLGRALVALGAELGLPPVREDKRRGLALEAGDAEAIALLDQVLALEPGDAEARSQRAWALSRSGRRTEARSELQALAAGSGPLADGARGLLALEAGDPEAAEACFRRAIAAAPATAVAHEALGRMLLERGQLDEAERELILASMLAGPLPDLPQLMAGIVARRRAAASAPQAPAPAPSDR